MTTKTKDTTAHTPELALHYRSELEQIDLLIGTHKIGHIHTDIPDINCKAIADRLASSWNACAALPDPAVVPELVEALWTALPVLIEAREMWSNGEDCYASAENQARALLARCGKGHAMSKLDPEALPTIPEALRFYAAQMRWSGSRMAAELGLTRSHYSEILSGRRRLPFAASRVAYSLGVPADVLMQEQKLTPNRPRCTRSRSAIRAL